MQQPEGEERQLFSFVVSRCRVPTAVSYQIKCEKDGPSVKASYDLSVPPGDSALISSFSLTVGGTELINQDQWVPGQVKFTGTQFTRLAHADQDALVAFSISSNEGWIAGEHDVLRGQKRFDDVSFANS